MNPANTLYVVAWTNSDWTSDTAIFHSEQDARAYLLAAMLGEEAPAGDIDSEQLNQAYIDAGWKHATITGVACFDPGTDRPVSVVANCSRVY